MTTEAGRALLGRLYRTAPGQPDEYAMGRLRLSDDIAAIEAEARREALREAREAVAALTSRDDLWDALAAIDALMGGSPK